MKVEYEVYKPNESITFILTETKTIYKTNLQAFIIRYDHYNYSKQLERLRDKIRNNQINSTSELITFCKYRPGLNSQMYGLELVPVSFKRIEEIIMSDNISKRETRSKRIPEIDSLYVYKTRHEVKFIRRQQPGEGYRYTQDGAVLKAGEGEIHIYHRTVTINGITQGLTMVTKNGKFREVQKWFNEQVELIKENEKLLTKFNSAKTTPSELGLKYLY